MTAADASPANRLLAIAALSWALAAAALEFSYLTADPDLWGHLYFGADHWGSGALRRVDPYSFTAAGRTWINHEWLAELLFFVVYDSLGDAGLLMGKLAVGLAVVLMMWRMARWRSFDPVVAAGVMTVGVLTMKPGFMIRPQLFSFLLFTVAAVLLHAWGRGRRRPLSALPVVMAAWANLHGGFLMGGLLAAVFILAETGAFRRSGGRRRLACLWGWGAAGALATLLNPYGWGLHRFLAQSLSVPRNITEWAPVPLWGADYPAFKILVLMVLVAAWIRRRRGLSWETAALAVIGVAAFRQQRHMVFFAILAVPYLVDVFSGNIGELRRGGRWPALSPAAAGCLAAALFLFAAGYALKTADRYRQSGMRIVVDPSEYPLQAAAFLQANALQGDLLVDFDWGEYAIWHLYPGCRVSIDGRFRTVYPQRVIDDHFLAGDDDAGWRRTLARYPADLLMVRRSPFFERLVGERGEWVYVYSDPLAMVFLRDSPENRGPIRRFREGRMRYEGLARQPFFPG